MIYQLIKAAHIASVMTFIGGLLILALCLRTANLTVVRAARRWDRRFTTPALAIAMGGQWFGNIWLTTKLVAVAGLSGLHGVLSGTVRRIEPDAGTLPIGNAALPDAFCHAGAAVVALLAVIVFLAVLKPAFSN